MANGVFTPVIPVANDIITGEFKAYLNFGLPTETLLGATSGGCKVDIDRKIRAVKSDGVYGYQLDSNGVPLVRYDALDVTITLKQLYLKFFHNKVISNCESNGAWESGDWDETGGTYAAETTIVLEGDQAAKCTGDTQNHGIHEVFSTPKNLNVFDNGETSGDSDKICFGLYITSANLAKLSSCNLGIYFANDVEGTLTNYLVTQIGQSSLVADKWNAIKIAKSDFSAAGSGAWNAVTGISFGFVGGNPVSSCTFIIDSISLLHNQDVSAPVPVNGGGCTYTNETTYRQYRPTLEITANDYVENLTLVGQRLDGKMIKMILKDCLNDGKISKALQEKNEVIDDTQFSGHYKSSKATTPPFVIREYVS